MASLAATVNPRAVAAAFQGAAPSSSASRMPVQWNSYMVGAAYYPEWWPESDWETDFRQMQEVGVNTIRAGEFAWAIFEPVPGKFEFEWMDKAIALGARHGVSTILCTPTASIPPWLYEQHADVLSGNDAGDFTYGGRKGYNVNSPSYLEACARIVNALAEHYGHNPNVIGWQLDNEPGHPPQLYDPVSERAFQQWLKKRYGTLDKLNKEWNGAFWSNYFTAWTQIKIPRNSAEGGWQPAISLAFRRFYSDAFLNHLRRQADILHAKTERQFVFTNWPSPAWSVDTYAAAAEFLDATAWDNYVSAPGLGRMQRQYISSFLSDFARCAGPHQRFLCAEQNAYVPPIASPEGLRVQAYMDFAHGAHGQLFFEWRRPVAGNEEHRPSFIKGFDGEINPAKDTLHKIATEMARLGPRLASATTTSDIAVLYDFTNSWAQGYGGIGDRNPRYGAETQAFYNAFKSLQQNIDVVPLSVDFSRYKLVVAANLRLVDDATAERLRAYVAAGGALLLNYRAGTQQTDNSMRLELAPGPFTQIAGVHSEAMLDLTEYSSQNGLLTQEQQADLAFGFNGNNTLYHPRTIMESLVLRGAETLATIRTGRMSGRPAVTRNRYQQGWVYYVGVDALEDEFYENIARLVASTVKLAPLIAAPYGVEVTTRQDGATTYYFLINMTEAAHNSIALPHAMDDLIADRKGISQISLPPLGVALLASR